MQPTRSIAVALATLSAALMMGTACSCTGEPESKPAKAPSSQPSATQPDMSLQVTDVDGKPHHPLEADGASGVVLLFIAADCPISNSYAPEIGRICKEYEGSGPGKFRF